MASGGGNDKAIITEAANKYGIPAKVLWGLYGTETNFGHNVKASSAGAVGPFQFEPATARSMGINPYDFKSAAFGAARYLSQYKSRGVGGMLSAYNAGPAGGYQSGYVNTTLSNANSYGSAPGGVAPQAPANGGGNARAIQEAINVPGYPGVRGTHATTQLNFDKAGYQKAKGEAEAAKLITSLPGGKEYRGLLGGQPKIGEFLTSKTSPGLPPIAGAAGVQVGRTRMVPGAQPSASKASANYVHPLPPSATIGRTDMGVDASMKPGDPIRAIGPGKVLGIYPNWYAGQPYLSYELTGGSHKGQVIYVAEQIQPRVKPGETLEPGRIIANYAPSGTGIETGFGTRGWQTEAQATTGYSEGGETAAGKRFRALLRELEGR